MVKTHGCFRASNHGSSDIPTALPWAPISSHLRCLRRRQILGACILWFLSKQWPVIERARCGTAPLAPEVRANWSPWHRHGDAFVDVSYRMVKPWDFRAKLLTLAIDAVDFMC